MCTIQESIDVHFPDCTPVRIKHWVEVEGNKYVKIAKSDASMVRLLTGQGVGASRALARTNIVETLISLRNSMSEELLRASLPEASKAEEDLGMVADDPRHLAKRRRRLAGALPDVLEIEAPALGDIASIRMNVLRQRPDQPLWVELVPENLDYLRAYVLSQIEAGDVKQPAPGESRSSDAPKSPAPGVIWATDRSSFRARYKDTDGDKKTKDFKQSSLAIAFMRGSPPALPAGEPAVPLQDGDAENTQIDAFGF